MMLHIKKILKKTLLFFYAVVYTIAFGLYSGIKFTMDKVKTGKVERVQKRAPLFFCVVVCMIAFGLYSGIKFTVDKIETVKLERAQKAERADRERAAAKKAAESARKDSGSFPGISLSDIQGATITKPDGITRDFVTPFKKVEMRPSQSHYYDDNDQVACSTEYPYVQVDETYYTDTLLIGDSRISGLYYYGNLPGATFAFKDGVSAFTLRDAELTTDGTNKTNLENVLSARQYGKIYIMLGINELEWGNSDEFAQKYKENIEYIRSKQPDSLIIIMGIMKLSAESSAKSKSFNNDNIDDRNQKIARIANGTNIFYLDVGPSVGDENGVLNPEYSWDGIHLKAQYYKLWADYMSTRGYVNQGTSE